MCKVWKIPVSELLPRGEGGIGQCHFRGKYEQENEKKWENLTATWRKGKEIAEIKLRRSNKCKRGKNYKRKKSLRVYYWHMRKGKNIIFALKRGYGRENNIQSRVIMLFKMYFVPIVSCYRKGSGEGSHSPIPYIRYGTFCTYHTFIYTYVKKIPVPWEIRSCPVFQSISSGWFTFYKYDHFVK
jgi:hypothetical protein